MGKELQGEIIPYRNSGDVEKVVIVVFVVIKLKECNAAFQIIQSYSHTLWREGIIKKKPEYQREKLKRNTQKAKVP